MRNLNEQISRMKSLMLIKEQCVGTNSTQLQKCEQDLENNGYIVYSSFEQYNLCENKVNLKNVNIVLDSNSINTNNKTFGKEEDGDCYLLAKSVKEEENEPKFHITFYDDNQVVITARLDRDNNGFKKLLYDGKYKAEGSSIGFSPLKYKGVLEGGSFDKDSFPIMSGSSSTDILTISASDGASWGIPSGELDVQFYLPYFLESNILTSSLTLSNVLYLLKTS